MRDICDGEFVRNHLIFSEHFDGLQFLLYYDDIEVCNALGAKAGKHKLGKLMTMLVYHGPGYLITLLLCAHIYVGVFYYTLGNIRPMFRSSLQAMQLVAIAKASDIHTYSCDSLLEPFVESTNKLARV